VSKLPLIALVAQLSILSWSKVLLADPLAELAIQWEAPPECPNRVALIDELRRDLEGSQVPSVALVVAARVERPRVDVWKVTIITQSAEGVSDRVVSSRTCAALLDATSLIVAMMIDPETAAAHARPSDDGPEGTAVPGEPSAATLPNAGPSGYGANAPLPPLPHPNTPARDSRALAQPPPADASINSTEPHPGWPLAGTIAMTSALDYGSLPGVSGSLLGSLGVHYGPLRAEGSFGYWLPRDSIAEDSDIPGAGGSFRKAAVLGRACADVWNPSAFTVSPCLGLGVAWFSGVANDSVPKSARATVHVAEPEIGVLATLKLTSHLALRFDLDVAVPLPRPEFGYTSGTDKKYLYKAKPASVRAGMGLEWKFGR
jgi:hypothetical protein